MVHNPLLASGKTMIAEETEDRSESGDEDNDTEDLSEIDDISQVGSNEASDVEFVEPEDAAGEYNNFVIQEMDPNDLSDEDVAPLLTLLQNVDTEIQDDLFLGLMHGQRSDLNVAPETNGIERLEQSIHDISLHEDDGIDRLEQSIHEMSIHEDHGVSETINDTQQDLLVNENQYLNTPSAFGLEKFAVPPLLCRHPPPAVGRDDDMGKLREILDDVLVKMGCHEQEFCTLDRIILGADNKIGANMLKLMKHNEKYNIFIPEFPLLHLRKSKITTLFSAYKHAGLLSLLKFMRDDDRDEWSKLVSADHIDTATRNVRRLGLAISTAFTMKFASTLSLEKSSELLEDLQSMSPPDASVKWEEQFQSFLEKGKSSNATFQLHFEMMRHCNQVIAVHLAERIGGTKGYLLLLGSIKSDLPFTFLNGASSYAPYCTQLLIEHAKSGIFHKHMKSTLFSVPRKSSKKNFALDAFREMDHIDAHKSIRSGSTLSSVTCRMSLVDSLGDNHEQQSAQRGGSTSDVQEDTLGWELTKTDVLHIMRTAALILRRDGLCMEEDIMPYNVYSKEKTVLPLDILDSSSADVGRFLVKRYISKNGLLQCNESDIPDVDQLDGDKDLIGRVKRSKGVTIRRGTRQITPRVQSQRAASEIQRKKRIRKEIKRIECLSSDMNMCQAIVKPDCSKPKVQKSLGVSKAVKNLVASTVGKVSELETSDNHQYTNIIATNLKGVPQDVGKSLTLITVEFAGVKFKVNASTGMHYIRMIENSVIKPILFMSPNLKQLIICEEKYSFTPDTFKAATRAQRTTSAKDSIAHLKTRNEMINKTKFDKAALVSTTEGKFVISTYLAENVESLTINENISIIIDSELHLGGCSCRIPGIDCNCNVYAKPITCEFSKVDGLESVTINDSIQQRKGEAEMSQVDWLFECLPFLQPGESVASLVTSGDIDAVPIHLFAIERSWPKNEAGRYNHTVYVILQKPGKHVDIYNITSMLELLHMVYNDQQIGQKVALTLCMGGNDFLPKFYQISHDKMLKLVMSNEYFLNNLFNFNDQNVTLNQDIYVGLVKSLYCPKALAKKQCATTLEYEVVRNASIHMKKGNVVQTRDPQLWMPPESALHCVGKLINLQAQYMLTAGISQAPLPDFLASGCLKRTISGDIEYDFGSEAHVEQVDMPAPANAGKRRAAHTPQKGRRRKIPLVTSTPKKQ